MCVQPSNGRQHQRSRALPGPPAITLTVYALFLVFISTALGASVLARAESRADAGRRLLTDEGEPCPVADVQSLYSCIQRATGRVVLTFLSNAYVLHETLRINVSAALIGSQASGNAPGTILSCGSALMGSLIEFSGSQLHIVGMQLQDCSTTGLNITSGMDVDVVIEDSVFQNFTRVLEYGRLNLSATGLPSPWTSSTGALALHAGNFSGNLTVRNTRFLSNSFHTLPSPPPPPTAPPDAASPPDDGSSDPGQRRALYQAWDGYYHADRRRLAKDQAQQPRQRQLLLQQVQQQQRTLIGATQDWDAFVWLNRRRRRLAVIAAQEMHPRLVTMSPWVAGVDDSIGAYRGFRRRMTSDETFTNSYTKSLLQKANTIHPGVQAGPWGDDAEAVLSVVCGLSKACGISFENSVFDGNTGVATGAVYILCDGAQSCDVSLTDTNVTNNAALWQQSAQFEKAGPCSEAAGDAPPAHTDFPFAGPGSSELDMVERLQRMSPWLTYLYPLLYYYDQQSMDPDNWANKEYFDLTDYTLYPNVTGRTLGAVVLHQRGSPAVGVAPSAARPMMTVTVSGGTFSGNDGAAIMSTATDFMELAGGSGRWSGAPPRHSADFSMSGVRVDGHNSGWPAVWIRWARKVAISGVQVTDSSGGVWLDEVRDSALVQNSTFSANVLSNGWLDYMSFLTQQTGGVRTSHVVKIQMTPLGEVGNSVIVDGCHFEGNLASNSGVLNIRGADAPVIDDADSQLGETNVVVSNSVFLNNKCGWVDPDKVCMPSSLETCPSPARPLRIFCVQNATVQHSRFFENSIGGLDIRSVQNITIVDSEFDDNHLTFNEPPIYYTDKSFGGGAVYAGDLGSTGGMTIQATNFTRNTASLGGGAIFARLFGPLNIVDCRFEGNAAETLDGGAIWLDYSIARSSITRTNFTQNSAGRNGGAISASNVASSVVDGLTVVSCTFTGNEALLNPALWGYTIIDQAGGGAVFATATSLHARYCSFEANAVFGHAGGAVRIVESVIAAMEYCNFTSNAAVMGGAVALSRLTNVAQLTQCIFTNNSVVDPRVLHGNAAAPSQAYIDPGHGGAVYAKTASLVLSNSASFCNNSAKYGGAIAALSSPQLTVNYWSDALFLPYFYSPVSADVLEAVGLPVPEGYAYLPSRYLFSNNTALIGGALYVYGIQNVALYPESLIPIPLAPMAQYLKQNERVAETAESTIVKRQPAIVFIRNTANGGGAIYLEGNGGATIKGARFVANRAVVPPLAANYSGLNGLEKDYGTAKALACYNGGGGGMCIVGQANTTISVSQSDMIGNAAKDGAGVFIAEGLDCVGQAGCYNVTMDALNITGNAATSRGGAVFWMHEGILQISTCPSDRVLTLPADIYNASTFSNASTIEDPGTPTVTFRVPVRKPPTSWYQQLTRNSQDAMLASVGGPDRLPASSPLYATNGEVRLRGRVILAASADEHVTAATDHSGLVAAPGTYFDPSSGTLVSNSSAAAKAIEGGSDDGDDSVKDANAEQVALVPVASLPVVLDNAVVLDPSWLGIPYDNLPCANWKDNTADTGPDVSSTPFFLVNPPRLDFYTSNTDININVTVHDWLGYPCTGGNDTQPVILVQAVSTEISGAVTTAAQNGTAVFTALRLRAQQGLHNVSMTGRSQVPARELRTSQLTINVRPCTINEFLSPKNLDECIPCDTGSYNLNVSAVSCQGCPDNADCGYPDPAACKLDTGCDPVGYLVPEDGYWHANFFSEEVIECTNSDACTSPNRTALLSRMQFQIWKASRQLQLNSSNAVADAASREAMAQLLSSPLARRLLQANKALQDDVYFLLVLNATADLMPAYMQTQCAEGYTGTLCGVCAEGYGWRRIATCAKCPPKALNNLYYALVTLLTLSLLAFTIYSSLKEQRRPGLLVGGLPAASGEKASKSSKPPKVNPSAGVLGVQASGPSQFHAIIAAAAIEDAAAEAAPALALLRKHERSASPLGDVIEGAYEYVDPVLAAARAQYASAPGTPKGRPMSPAAPFPLFDTAVRSHSVLGVPARASRWVGVEERTYVAASFSRPHGAADLNPAVHVSSPGASSLLSGGGGAAAATAATVVAGNGVTATTSPSRGAAAAAGPVAEGALPGYDNALYEGTAMRSAAVDALSSLEIVPVEEPATETEGEGEVAAVARAVRLSAMGRPVAESKDYTNVLFEDPRTAEVQSADGPVVAAATSPRGPQTPPPPSPGDAVPDASAKDSHSNLQEGPVGTAAAAPGPADDTSASVLARLAAPPTVMLQSVPVLHTTSPPRTPLHHGSITSAPPGGLELPTVAERVRIGDLPKRGAVVGRERAHQSTIVKIFVSYVQVLALLQNVPLNIPGVVDVYYRINNQAISYPGILVSLDCSLPESSVSKAFVRVILTVLAPLYIFAGAMVWFLIFNALDYYIIAPWFAKHPSKKNRKRHLPMPSFAVHMEVYLGRQLIVTFITIFFFFYPSVVQSLMTIFNCQDVNVQSTDSPLANGLGLVEQRIWSQDYALQCYRGSHLALVLGLGVPGVILIAIGWPLMSALFMTGKLTCMNNIRFTEDMTSFFLADFKARFAWWESIIMLRKLFIAVIVTLVDGQTQAGVQLLLVICILVIAAAIHLMTMPYHHTYTNNLELCSLGTLLATLYFSLYFGFSTSISDGGRVAISVLILVINIVMVLVFVYYIVQAYFYAALCKTGLNSIDRETRRKLTAAELQQRIFENLTAEGSNTSFNQDTNQQNPPIGDRQRTSYQRVASLYAAAVWASMRVGSTTNKVVTRMRTLLRDPNASHPSSRQGSVLEMEGVPLPNPSADDDTKAGNSGQGNDDDPEAARSSAVAAGKRAVSGQGMGSVTATANVHERSSQSKLRAGGKDGSIGHSRSVSNSQSHSNPGTGPTGGSQASSVVAPLFTGRTSNGSHRENPTPRTAPQVISRGSSAASLENPSLPPFPTELDSSVHLASPAPVVPTPPAAPQVPPAGTSPMTSPRSPTHNVRSQSRLAYTTSQADRSGELLPPPPVIPGRSNAPKP